MGILPDFAWQVCALTPEVSDDRGLRLAADSVGASLAPYDMIFVPGGFATRRLQHDGDFIAWLAGEAARERIARQMDYPYRWAAGRE